MERTLAIIKPDALGNHENEILHIIQKNGFTVLHRARLQLSVYQAMDFYAEHAGKPFFDALVGFMTSGPVLVLALAHENAVSKWRTLLGPTDSRKARESDPKSIRALFGTDNQRNAAHGSDSKTSAQREIFFFFPSVYAEDSPSPPTTVEYLETSVFPVLSRGLAALCAAKPTNPVEWLGRWLYNNNPQKPVGKQQNTGTSNSQTRLGTAQL